jgi:photosystem II stability/assembly factor-like uncharacterized protein
VNGALLWLLAATASAASPAASLDPGVLPAEHARLASQSLLIDLGQAGARLVAVGERGHVLLSDNKGQTWRQAKRVPTQNLLTGVCFSDERHGIAVGHDEIILTTADGGETWTRRHYAPEAQQPLLDVLCNGRDAIAVGAYSVYFSSADSGGTWSERKFSAAAPDGNKTSSSKSGASSPARQAGTSDTALPGAPQATNQSTFDADDTLAEDFHLNRIVAASGSRLYIAAEAGHLYRSDDAGATWIELPSPYEGSFFGVLPLNGDSLLAYGLRGHLFRSDDGGMTWRAIETHTEAMLNDAVRLPRDGVAVVGLSGAVLESNDDGEHFTLAQQSDRRGLSAVLPDGATDLVTVGEGGIKLVPWQPPK